MGCSFSTRKKNDNSCIKTLRISSKLPEIRDTLRSCIIYLHSISLSCNKSIETCAFDQNKPLAITLKSKQFYIKSKQSEIQTLIGQIDLYLEGQIKNHTQETKLIKQSKVFLTKISENILTDDSEKLLNQNNSAYVAKVNKEIAKQGLDLKKAEDEIDHEFKVSKINFVANGSIKRRKYLKPLSLSFG
ncbi:hypothetical protein SteCoe_34524 [Stentor coeruleus]|uniref:Uncharacterized protein n=1 Tax=Stentor coeruleus TaxID=5963 RepID=A0A1R2AUP1_9CILI|nr:hypothetical protein SteCoe_34524 [Stentor coeruleus]